MFNSVIRSGVAGIRQAEVGDFRADSDRPTAVGRENPWAGASVVLPPPIRLMTSPLGCNRWEPRPDLPPPPSLQSSTPCPVLPFTWAPCSELRPPGQPGPTPEQKTKVVSALARPLTATRTTGPKCSYRPSLGHSSPAACAPSCIDTTCISHRIQRTSTRTTPIRNIHSS